MRITKEYHICDRCKKEIKEEEINNAYYTRWYYELCNECFEKYTEFNKETNKLKKKWEKLEQKYQFGDYLPKEDDKGDE